MIEIQELLKKHSVQNESLHDKNGLLKVILSQKGQLRSKNLFGSLLVIFKENNLFGSYNLLTKGMARFWTTRFLMLRERISDYF